ncbi:MAG TPA: hypothetical protein VIG93_04725 [Gaiellaceae bacterium]
MARGAKPKQELPPPLPPERRTVGQLVGEAIRIYGAHFWKGLALGVPVVAINGLVWRAPSGNGRFLVVPVAALLISLSYVAATVLVMRTPWRSRHALTAYVVAVLVFLPFPFLTAIYVLPGVVWLALVGLAVPAALVEGLGLRASLVRGYRLARADFVHVLGGLATLALVVFLTQFSLYFVLREYAENTRLIAAALASLVVSPLVFLGAAVLYLDQDARLRSRG